MTAPSLPETCAVPGVLWVSPATALYLGPALGLAAHSTSVHCLVVGVDGPLELQVGSASVAGRSVLVPPRTVHRVVAARDSRILFCYNDATAARGRELAGCMTRAGLLATAHRAEAELLRLCAARMPSGVALFEAAFGAATPPEPRIRRTVERIRSDPAGSAAALAQAEHLSAHYLLRLFGRETGTSLRRYRRWARMLRAAESIAAGSDLTRAAADAGFASPSHFSDAFLAMFGLTATALLGTGARLIVAREPIGWAR
ncbi:helix-turn-helix domain-containing protein [Tsukamurella pulmonis]|uniref:helix-turn-helix domain-containing protein n=1 Tax=Tsukamurella pulmonis TaxID=47312 RepID=UPI001EDEBFBE|nr:helix-turn-helix domain-containing protein [Tsukamurella pulmonis]